MCTPIINLKEDYKDCMQNYINMQSIKAQHDFNIPTLFRLIEEEGGYVERDVYLTPSEAEDITFQTECPWIKRFYGDGFTSWDSVCQEAAEIAQTGKKGPMSDSLRRLANTFTRQRTPVRTVARHSLSTDLSNVGRFRHALEMTIKYDAPIYNSSNTDPVALKHYLNYITKYSPLSQYCPDIWIRGLKGYGETRAVTSDENDLRLLAKCLVSIQKAFGVLDHLHELDPNDLESTQRRGHETNPTAAHSLPTMANAKNEEERVRVLGLAREYQANPKAFGNIPYVGNRRIQQGGNVIIDYIERLYPTFNKDQDYPTLEMFDAAMDLIAAERPWYTYYSKDPVVDTRHVKCDKLPSSDEARESLVNDGLEDKCILLKHSSTGEYRFNYKIMEPNPWKLVMDDEALKAEVNPIYHDMMASKNRNVFAGSNAIALNKQAFVHKCVDMFKEWTENNGHKHMTASWKEPSQMRKIITNFTAIANDSYDSSGKIHDVDSNMRCIYGCLSGDDKSKFDNFQPAMLWALFNCCILAPCFKKEHHALLKHLSVQTYFTGVMTYEGLMWFSECMASGEGATNFQDGFISAIVGLYDLSDRTERSPEAIMKSWEEHEVGELFQGDDFQSGDNADAAMERKEDNYAKFGLKVARDKSLISPYASEYVRMFTDGNWRYNTGAGAENWLASHAPLLHCLVKVDFGENQETHSPAIADMANINRTANLQFHPRFDDITADLIQYTNMGMGCKPQWYVPEYVMKEWRKAGSPGPNTSQGKHFYVKIDSPTALMKVASKEAEAKGENLNSVTDKSWQSQYDDESTFEQQRVVKMLNAIRTKNNKMRNNLADMVVNEPLYNS